MIWSKLYGAASRSAFMHKCINYDSGKIPTELHMLNGTWSRTSRKNFQHIFILIQLWSQQPLQKRRQFNGAMIFMKRCLNSSKMSDRNRANDCYLAGSSCLNPTRIYLPCLGPWQMWSNCRSRCCQIVHFVSYKTPALALTGNLRDSMQTWTVNSLCNNLKFILKQVTELKVDADGWIKT